MPGSLARLGVGLASAAVAWAAAPVALAEDGATPEAPIVVSDADTPRRVLLSEQSDGTLSGTISLVVRSTTDHPVVLRIRYVPADGQAALDLPGADDSIQLLDRDGTPAERAPWVKKGRARVLRFRFSVASDQSPADLEGQLTLSSMRRAAAGRAVVVSVIGQARDFAGMTFQPPAVTIHAVSDWGPLAKWVGDAGDRSEPVRLVGPGVPRLLEADSPTVSSTVLLRDGTDREAQAELTNLTRISPLVAQADLDVTGELRPGKYEGKLPLSQLAPQAPHLSIAVETRDAFWWPVIAVLLGVAVSLWIFLVTGLNRRKAVLRANLRAVLDEYRKKLAESGQERPLWNMGWLGRPADWFKTDWSAMPELNPVQGTWSEIAYARNDADLDEDEDHALDVKSRLLRWLKTLGPFEELRKAFQAEPKPAPKQWRWTDTHTYGATAGLLTTVHLAEPEDDAAGDRLVRRLTLQTTWHEQFAKVWCQYGALERIDASAVPLVDEALKGVREELERLDEAASSESARTVDELIKLLVKLDACARKLAEVKETGLEATATEARPTAVGQQQPLQAAETLVARTAEAESAPIVQPRAPKRAKALEGVIRLDLFSTPAIVAITAVAYMVPLYTSTWGSAVDYGTAFAAGVVGKAVIDWATMPAFRTLRLRKRAAAAAAAAGAAAGATAVKKAEASPGS